MGVQRSLCPSQRALRSVKERKCPFFLSFVVGANDAFKVEIAGFVFAPTLVREPFVRRRKKYAKMSLDEQKRANFVRV